jgi:RNA polymerase sigma-70 factor (ECF subfamily)
MAGAGDEVRTAAALEELCRIYRQPILVFILHSGHRHADAEDLTQSFLVHLLRVNPMNRLAPEHGRFRSYLLTMLKNFLATQHRYQTRRKRGGGAEHLSLEQVTEETQSDPGLQIADAPGHHFDRTWAETMVNRAIERLREEYQRKDRTAELDLLLPHLDADPVSVAYRELADQLGIKAGAARVRVHRLRQHYQQLLDEELAQTCDRESLEDERRALMAAFTD